MDRYIRFDTVERKLNKMAEENMTLTNLFKVILKSLRLNSFEIIGGYTLSDIEDLMPSITKSEQKQIFERLDNNLEFCSHVYEAADELNINYVN